MFKIILTTIASIMFSTTIVLAGGDIMASRYGNTTISTDAKGVQTKVYYNADHTFTFKSGDRQGKGTWKVDYVSYNATLCLSFEGTPPAGMTNPFCVPVEPHEVGNKWTVGDGDNKRSLSLEKGIQ